MFGAPIAAEADQLLKHCAAFYSKLFGVQPVKRRPGYANFAVEQPPLKLVLIEGEPGQPTVMDHLGVEIFSSDEVAAATARLQESGLVTSSETDTECCYALQDKVWVRGPGDEAWEGYVVKGEAGGSTRPPAASAAPASRPSSTPSSSQSINKNWVMPAVAPPGSGSWCCRERGR